MTQIVESDPTRGTPRGRLASRRSRLTTGRRDLAILVVLVIIAVSLPSAVSGATLFLWETVAVQAIFALGTNMLIGDTDIHTFGQAAFYGTGGYTIALLTIEGWSVPTALLAAAIMGILIGALIGWLSMPLMGIGSVMMTVAVAQSLYSLSGRSSLLGGDNGKSVEPNGVPIPVAPEYGYFIFGVCFLLGALIWLIRRSPYGALQRAIRDDPVRVVSMGINVRLFRASVFMVSGAFCAVAGALTALTQFASSPEFFFWLISGNALIMVVLGGMGTFWGPIIGAAAYTLLIHELQDRFPDSSVLVSGLCLLALVLIAPRGLVGGPRRIRYFVQQVSARRGES
jgi:branched-chain amino acid transport system permease protein